MKKVLALLLAAVLCFALCACGGGGQEMEIEVSEDMAGDDVVVAALRTFMQGELYEKLLGGYEDITGSEGRGFTITQATEYQIPDLEGRQLHLMMINADADVYVETEDTIYDRVILLVNMDDGKVYDNYYSLNVANFTGAMESDEDVLTYCMAVYNSYLMGSNEGIMTSTDLGETHTELSAEEIAAINEAIK